MTFRDMEEEARVEKASGEVLGPYKAVFAGDTIIVNDPKADVEEGDTVLRKLPNGRDERSLVTQADFYNTSKGGFRPHYQLAFRRGGQSDHRKPGHQINIGNAQSVQIGDHNVQTIVSSFDTLLKKIESSETAADQKEEAKSLLKQFLAHPLVVKILGGAGATLLG